MPPDVIERMMSKHGKYDVATTEYRRFKSSVGVHKANTTIEYLHILEKP
jgi:adenine-specific DNA-methyltransferase